MKGLHPVRVPVALGERSYDIVIGAGVLQDAGRQMRKVGLSGRVAVVTNPLVGKWYRRQLVHALKTSGFQVCSIIVPDAERTKSLKWVSAILDELVSRRFERNDVLVALGGGVIGDLTGFAASIYLRGIPFVQVATTLIAQVDSSVGGKTGVNHRLGKNLIGTFHQPRLVLVDTETLTTLPRREWTAGLAEVIKYGVIADHAFFDYLERHVEGIAKQEPEPVQFLVRRCCEIKASVVAADERESGLRRILNYGHTIGHALEALGNYRFLIHGEAVAIGMAQEAGLSHFLGYCSSEVVDRQRDLIRRVGLPDRLPPLRWSDLWRTLQHDKKVVKGSLHWVLPRDLGHVEVSPVQAAKVRAWFRHSQRGLPKGR